MDDTGRNNRVYAFGCSPAAIGMVQGQSAEANAEFFANRLAHGVRVLDLSYGPGSITVDLAMAFIPRTVPMKKTLTWRKPHV